MANVKIAYVVSKSGVRVRGDVPPHKPISDTVPTKVIWSTYWQRRLNAGEIEVVTASHIFEAPQQSAVTESVDSDETASVEPSVEPSDESDGVKKSKKNKKSKE